MYQFLHLFLTIWSLFPEIYVILAIFSHFSKKIFFHKSKKVSPKNASQNILTSESQNILTSECSSEGFFFFFFLLKILIWTVARKLCFLLSKFKQKIRGQDIWIWTKFPESLDNFPEVCFWAKKIFFFLLKILELDDFLGYSK